MTQLNAFYCILVSLLLLKYDLSRQTERMIEKEQMQNIQA